MAKDHRQATNGLVEGGTRREQPDRHTIDSTCHRVVEIVQRQRRRRRVGIGIHPETKAPGGSRADLGVERDLERELGNVERRHAGRARMRACTRTPSLQRQIVLRGAEIPGQEQIEDGSRWKRRSFDPAYDASGEARRLHRVQCRNTRGVQREAQSQRSGGVAAHIAGGCHRGHASRPHLSAEIAFSIVLPPGTGSTPVPRVGERRATARERDRRSQSPPKQRRPTTATDATIHAPLPFPHADSERVAGHLANSETARPARLHDDPRGVGVVPQCNGAPSACAIAATARICPPSRAS